MVRTMTEIEGGLDEPTELEPEQGSLALAAEDDRHDRSDWEKAAAAVLRKARRLTDEDDDALVWEKLTRTTLDGIDVAPLGTRDRPRRPRPDRPSPAPRRTPAAGRRSAPRRLGHPRPPSPDRDAKADRRGGADRPRERRHARSGWSWVEGGLEPDDLAALLEKVYVDLAPVVLSAPSDPVAAARGAARGAGRAGRRPGARHQPRRRPDRRPGASGRSRDGAATFLGHRDPADGRRAGPRRAACSASSSTRPRSTTSAPPTPRSSATASPSARRTSGPSPTPAGASTRRWPAHRVPLRRHRRAVPDDRQAARRPPAVEPGRRAQRGRARRGRPAAARRHQPADDEQVRPLGEHAPHHRRRLRRGRRRRRRGHRAALRRRARAARRLRPPDRPQHQLAADLRVPRRQGRRPGRRVLRRREAHRRPRAGRLGRARPDRGGRRHPRRPRRRVAAGPHRRGRRRSATTRSRTAPAR